MSATNPSRDFDAMREYAEAERERANEAEAKLRRIEALADEHERMVQPAPYTSERALIERLRSALVEGDGR